MDIYRIRELREAIPYKPFRLIMRDGRQLPVARRGHVGFSPTWRGIAHASSDGGFEFIKIDDVVDAVIDESIQPIRSPR
jgi:hypothetical protein